MHSELLDHVFSAALVLAGGYYAFKICLFVAGLAFAHSMCGAGVVSFGTPILPKHAQSLLFAGMGAVVIASFIVMAKIPQQSLPLLLSAIPLVFVCAYAMGALEGHSVLRQPVKEVIHEPNIAEDVAVLYRNEWGDHVGRILDRKHHVLTRDYVQFVGRNLDIHSIHQENLASYRPEPLR